MDFLRLKFRKRIQSLKLDGQAREELFKKFIECWDTSFKCYYCKERMELEFENELSFTIDHYLAKSRGGDDIPSNLVFCCRTCNFLKGNQDAKKYIDNMERLKLRKNKREYFKAKKASAKDKKSREAYEQIFQHVKAKRGEQ